MNESRTQNMRNEIQNFQVFYIQEQFKALYDSIENLSIDKKKGELIYFQLNGL